VFPGGLGLHFTGLGFRLHAFICTVVYTFVSLFLLWLPQVLTHKAPFASLLLGNEEASKKLLLRFQTPESVALGGSFLLGTAARPGAFVQVNVLMPKVWSASDPSLLHASPRLCFLSPPSVGIT